MRPSRCPRVLLGRLLSSIALGLALAVTSPVASSGADVGARRVSLANADLGQGLVDWSPGATGTGAVAAGTSGDGRAIARLEASGGGVAWLEQDVACGTLGLEPAPASVWLGQRLSARARVQRAVGSAGGTARLQVLRIAPGTTEVLAEAVLDLGSAMPGRWLDLVAEPRPGALGRVTPDTLAVRTRLEVTGRGGALLDRVLLGGHEPLEVDTLGGSFDAAGSAWLLQGAERVGTSGAAPAFRGRAQLRLEPGGRARGPVRLEPEPGRPWANAPLTVGAWLRVQDAAGLASQVQPGVEVELAVWALRRNAAPLRLAHGAWRPTTRDAKAWRWFEAVGSTPVPLDAVRLEVELRSSLPVRVHVDEVQLGSAVAVDGVPATLRLAAWQPWYRSPAHPEATGLPASPRETWRNWAWQVPSPCAPTSNALLHDPSFVRVNGRRDGAVGEVDGLDALPLVGLYDSRDAHVARLSVDLARAAGLDGFVVDWHGTELDESQALPGEAPLERRAFEVLLSAAERPGVDFRLAPMLEPKVLQAGWVRPGAPLAERRAALTTELVTFVARYGDRRPMLRVDGELVVFVFWHDLPGWDGQSLGEAAWAQLEAEVEAATGDRVTLCATHPPEPNSATFQGYARWHLVEPSVARYATWQDFQSGQEQVPQAGAVEAMARTVRDEARAWAALDDVGRRPWSVAWWGFDDSGVAGWASPHWAGSDGAPTCVRITAEHGVDFLEATLAGGAGSRLLIPTWNDWNERTALEPSWDAVYEAQLRGGLPIDSAARQRALAGLLTLREALGAPGSPQRFDALLARYFAEVAAGRATAYQ